MSEPGTARPVRILGVASGKGGVGKSHLAANLAVHAAQTGARVLVIDADLGLANVDILLGVRPEAHLGQVLSGQRELEEVLASGPFGLKLLPAGTGLPELTRLDDGQKLRLVTALDGLESAFDLVVIDSGAGIGDNVLFFVGAAQEALLVVNPEPTALTDAYAAVKALALDAGVALFNVVVNPVATDGAAQDVFQKLSSVTSRFLDVRMRYLGRIPRDENVHRAAMAQRPLLVGWPQSPASRAIRSITEALLDQPPPATPGAGLKFLWNRLFQEASGGTA